MPDCFALLDEPRRPWIGLDSLKAKFLARSAAVHPDRFHTATESEKQRAHQRYLELNAAYHVLREPKMRLQHLLELESGAKPKDLQRIPEDMADFFAEVGQLCRDVDAFQAERGKVTSPLLKVHLFERAQIWSGTLSELQKKIHRKRDELAAELQVMNRAWETAVPTTSPARRHELPLERLEQIYRRFSYLSRWTNQIQERLVQLTF